MWQGAHYRVEWGVLLGCVSSHICTLCCLSVLQLITLSLTWSVPSQKILWELVHSQYQTYTRQQLHSSAEQSKKQSEKSALFSYEDPPIPSSLSQFINNVLDQTGFNPQVLVVPLRAGRSCGVVRCVVVWCGVVWCGVVWCGVVCCGVVWCGVVWCGVAWRGVAWRGVAWRGVAWRGVAWCGVAWRGVAWRGVAWRGVAWRGVAWCGVAWCGVPKALLPKGKGRDVYPRVQVNGLGCVCCVRAVCKCVVA